MRHKFGAAGSRWNFSVLIFVIENIMKTSRFILVTLLGILPAVAVPAVPTRTIARAEVNFFEPKKFTDVRDSSMGDYERTTYLDQIRDHLLEQVAGLEWSFLNCLRRDRFAATRAGILTFNGFANARGKFLTRVGTPGFLGVGRQIRSTWGSGCVIRTGSHIAEVY